jgi:hypothetical protein
MDLATADAALVTYFSVPRPKSASVRSARLHVTTGSGPDVQIVGVEAPELAQREPCLDGGQERLDDGGLEEPGGLPVDDRTSPTVGAGRSWLVTAMRMRAGRSLW